MGRTTLLVLLVAVNLAEAALLWGLSRPEPPTVVVVWAAREDLPAVLAAASGGRPGWHDAAGSLGQVLLRHGLVVGLGSAVELAPSDEARAQQARIRAAQDEARALEESLALEPAVHGEIDAWARLRERLR